MLLCTTYRRLYTIYYIPYVRVVFRAPSNASKSFTRLRWALGSQKRSQTTGNLSHSSRHSSRISFKRLGLVPPKQACYYSGAPRVASRLSAFCHDYIETVLLPKVRPETLLYPMHAFSPVLRLGHIYKFPACIEFLQAIKHRLCSAGLLFLGFLLGP